MISPELRFEGFDSRSWTNLISLFAPGVPLAMESEPVATDDPDVEPGEASADRPRGTLVIVHDVDDRVLKAFHTVRGRVVGLVYDGPGSLPELCRTYSARRGVALREGVLEEALERLAMRLQRGDDYLTQWLVLLKILRELTEAGLMRVWPAPLANVRVPSPGMVRRAIDLVLPDDHCMVAMLWDGESPWTSIALRRRAGVIDLVVGPDLIGRWTGPLGGDFRRDYRVVADAVEKTVGPVHLGIFSEVSTVRELLRSADPGAWARAVAVRDVILHPTPPYLAVAIGADAVRGVARASARLLGGIDVLGAFAPFARELRSRVKHAASVSTTLGFDPLEALARLLRRDQPDAAEGDAPRD